MPITTPTVAITGTMGINGPSLPPPIREAIATPHRIKQRTVANTTATLTWEELYGMSLGRVLPPELFMK
jgi:hypothetical protein